MLGKREQAATEFVASPRHQQSGRRRWWANHEGGCVERSKKCVQPALRWLEYDLLEERRLLSGTTDLTNQIAQLLNSGQTSIPANLGNVALGSDLTFNNVTVTFGANIQRTGSDRSASVTIAATSASLSIGSGVSAQITGQGGNPGISGTYTLTDQLAAAGAYSLTASQFDLTLSKLLTAQSSDVTISYRSTAAAGQELVKVGSLSAMLLPFDDVIATVNDLDIVDNGFTLGDATISAPPITLGNVLSIDQPALELHNVDYQGDCTLSHDPNSTFSR